MLNMRVSLLIVVAIQAVSGQLSPEPEPDMGCPGNQYMCKTDFTSYCEDIGTCCEGSEKCFPGSVNECADDYNTFCECNSTMVDCYIDQYNAAGEYLYTNYSCVVNDDACPCADGYNKCTDEYGPWCQLEPCPCTGTQITCHAYSYDGNGLPIDTPVTCVNDISECKCGTGALSTPCTEHSGTLFECISSLESCPVVCNETIQKYCESYPFDANGYEDFDAKPNITCAPISSGCPCNSQWQEQCVDPTYGDTWCQSKDYNCPVTCTAPTTACVYHEYNSDGTIALDSSGFPKWIEKCVNLTSAGDCPCDPDYEIGCVEGSGASAYTQCYLKDSYELVDGKCPVNCEAQGKVECWPKGFDANGEVTSGQATTSGQFIGVCQDSYDDDGCLYDYTNGKICPGTETFVWSQTTCPQVCNAAQEKCYVYLFSPGGSDYNGSVVEECRPMGDACCDLVNGQECPSPDGGYCLGKSETCFLYCNSTQRICTHEAFHANGSHIEASFYDESCMNLDVACTCGAGATLCNPNSPATAYCIPSTLDIGPPGAPDIVTNTCPADCNAQQTKCGTTDYDARGNFRRYSERCIPNNVYAKQGCTCGGNATQCRYGPNPADFYCEPLWDKFEGKVFKCPMYCSGDNPEIHYVPNFDSNGNHIEGSFLEYCGAANAAPDCNRGQNAKSCVIDGITECIPTVGPDSFCPITCPADKIQCPAMDNYNSTTGEWVSSSAPPASQACQDKSEDCPCGAGARPCNGGCLPTVLSCPFLCTTAEKPNICTVTHYTGLEPTGETEYCISDNATCPCGDGSTPCSQKLGDTYEDVCYPTSVAAYVCPCKVGEKACNVKNFFLNGTEAEPSIVCVGANSPCPCGTHATKCKDGSCVAKYAKEGGCYQYCTIPEETAAIPKKTCQRHNLDQKTGAPASTVVQCATSCTPGRGQKKCGTGAIIPAQTGCRDIYGLNTASLTRRLSVASGQSQTSSVSFTIENLKNPMASVASTKPKIDGILQVQPTLETELIRQVGTTEASLQYKVTNLGASNLAPSQVVDALKKKLNTKSPDIMDALSGMGTVKLGSRGCCSSTTVSKTTAVVTTTLGPEPEPMPVVDSSTSTTSTPAPSPTPTSTSTAPSPTPTSTSTAPSPTPTSTSTAPSPTPTSTSTSAGPSTSIVGYSSSYSGTMHLQLSNCTQFVNDTAAQNALDESIADQITSVTANEVDTTTTCSAGGRRLSEDEKFEAAMRRLTETATVAFTITILSSTQHTDYSTAVTQINALTAAAVHQTLATKLTTLGKIDDYNITVVMLGTPTLDVTSSTAMATTSSSVADDLFEDDDGSVRSSIAWTTLVVLLAAIYRKC